ncbi:DUF3152 domain-containing protein [Micromonospora sp. WMMD712]|uniref:DUF3152 domain-containing protein n=1 Tax=Micromonospora sp. WMMD712 TaxID=3016096 RepID=UPI00249C3E72|nr:DUF3152 domain-containing protein [Micromonospora sp. WMMD712]WFE58126.1 DUF3152 domain-containing protein [Micromonospora sp. WMMD712]
MTSLSPSGAYRPRRPGRPGPRTALGGLSALVAVAAAVLLVLGAVPPTGPAQPGGAGAGAGDRSVGAAPGDRADQAGRAEQGRSGDWPTSGPGRFVAAAGGSPVRGAGGPVRRYRVLVERDTGQDADAFAEAVDEALGDPRSWTASGEVRLQRVAGPAAPAGPEAAAAPFAPSDPSAPGVSGVSAPEVDFTVYLATPVTSERMCALGGLRTERYTSCRLPGQVIINLARWMEAVPDYGAPLDAYRTYVVNHEVGHELGELHEACPGPGEPAPVMQQQTYGLDGCVANPWPYLDGRRYAGEQVPGT